MAELVMRRTLSGFDPVDPGALPKIKVGNLVKVQVSRPRNLRHNAKYWVLLGKVLENQSYVPTRDKLHQLIKQATGFAQVVHRKDGTPVTLYDSTSFENMNQEQFNEYYERVIRFVCEEIIPGLEDDALRAEVLSMVA